jgi:hypothetical protein
MGRRTRSQRRTRGQQGGSAGLPPSAWGNVFSSAGDGWTQFMNTLSLSNSSPSNVIVLNKNANINSKPMTGGKGRRRVRRRSQSRGQTRSQSRGQTRSRRGGNIGAVLNQALVPFSLVALNHFATKKNRKH